MREVNFFSFKQILSFMTNIYLCLQISLLRSELKRKETALEAERLDHCAAIEAAEKRGREKVSHCKFWRKSSKVLKVIDGSYFICSPPNSIHHSHLLLSSLSSSVLPSFLLPLTPYSLPNHIPSLPFPIKPSQLLPSTYHFTSPRVVAPKVFFMLA